MFLKNKNIIFKIRRSKVTDYAALRSLQISKTRLAMAMIYYKQLKKWTKLNPKINMMKLPFVLLNMKMSYSLIKIN